MGSWLYNFSVFFNIAWVISAIVLIINTLATNTDQTSYYSAIIALVFGVLTLFTQSVFFLGILKDRKEYKRKRDDLKGSVPIVKDTKHKW